MKLKTLVAGIVLVTTAPLAMADSDLYGALDLGQSTMAMDCSLSGAMSSLGFTSSTCMDKATSPRASLGYQINDNFGTYTIFPGQLLKTEITILLIKKEQTLKIEGNIRT